MGSGSDGPGRKATYVREALVAVGALALFLLVTYAVSRDQTVLWLALLIAVGWWASRPRIWGR
ncbi:MAG: hypothetical protein E6J23_09385 [Chloroflexi bacterium]|nr:MAG: hypothetical protein E6J23_09385 [Chloroflexota bacterium]